MKFPTGKAEPRFDIDYAYGRQGELQFKELLEWIANGNGQAEVKRKRVLDLWFYIETHYDKGRKGNYQPSGISVTTAKVWAFYLDDSGISVVFPTEVLRSMLDDPGTRDKEETHGSCPTRGKLVSFAVLLYREKKQREKSGVSVEKKPVDVEAATRVARELTDEDIRWG